jgi:hypothetical protein
VPTGNVRPVSVEDDLSKLRTLVHQISVLATEPKVLGTEVDVQRLAAATSDVLLSALEALKRRVERIDAERRPWRSHP